MNFSTSKNLAGIGAILLFVGILPYVNTYLIIPLVGIILLLIGLKGLSEYYQAPGIFNNALYGTITIIVGVVIVAAVLFAAILGFLSLIVPNWNGDWLTLANAINEVNWTAWSQSLVFSDIAPYLGMLILDWVIAFVFALVASLLFRKASGHLATKTGVGLFGATGTVMLIGGILTIVGFGYIILWISMLLFAIALFQVRPPVPPQAAPPQPTYQATV